MAWGFIDLNGLLVIPSEYQHVDLFSEGLAAVEYKGSWGYINKAGEWAIQPAFEEARSFSEGFAAVKNKGLWGYIDKSGQYSIPSGYIGAGDFAEGLAVVHLCGADDDGWGYINKNNVFHIIPQFHGMVSGAFSFQEGLAFARTRQSLLCINHQGEIAFILPGSYYPYGFSEGLVLCDTGKKDVERFEFYTKTGELAMKRTFSYARSFGNSLAAVRLKGPSSKITFIDKDGNEAFKASFKQAHSFSEGIASVCNSKGLWGCIDVEGNMIIEPGNIVNNQEKQDDQLHIEWLSICSEGYIACKVQEESK